jgi:beta-glucanase (GH16 family)
MITRINHKCTVAICCLSFIAINSSSLKAQNRRLVWAEEFNATIIDRSIWSFNMGPSNDNVHYYTDRSDNARIESGILRILALKESYEGFNYTAALLSTKNSINWRYGRMEARIKLPGTNGFVPAFWMMPVDDQYGWWPLSGEIDIMEHPTNSVDKIGCGVHFGVYGSTTGPEPRNALIRVPDAETAFHVYAIEWTPDKIDFYIDNNKHLTFNNDHGGFLTWPFNQPFYIILDVAVGGSWVGNPDASTVFPAVMEVDYVRVYQYMNDVAIIGADFVPYNSQSISYSVPDIAGASYAWSVPGDARIVSGQNTHQIAVDWGIFGGDISVVLTTGDGSFEKNYPVKVSSNYLKNAGFEKGLKYWSNYKSYLYNADFSLTPLDAHDGQYSMHADVATFGTLAWEVSLLKENVNLEAGTPYNVSFWAKTDGGANSVIGAIINASNYSVYKLKTIDITDSWAQYNMDFTATENATAVYKLDLGDHMGDYFFDDFVFTTPELIKMNLVKNADFSDSIHPWIFNTLWPAEATGTVQNGECAVIIDNGGVFTWDIHLGQTGFSIENGKEYIVSFDSYADEPRQISVIVGKNSDPWTGYSGDHIFSLTTAKQTYTFSFVMNLPTDHQARFGFDIGASSNDVFIDNVLLREATNPSNVNRKVDSFPESFKLYQNYPNPFNPVTTIKYYLQKPSDVSLKVINTVGQEIVTLADGFQTAGEHQIKWTPGSVPSGIYFIRLHAGDLSATRKIVLQK